jgi:hypothetical protein
MNKEFKVHRLNASGMMLAKQLAGNFDVLLESLKGFIPEGRYLAIVRTKLEEACFFAKKGLAENPENQEKE